MEPITRSEQYLASIIGEDVVLPVPQSRIEHYLNLIAQNGISPSSAGLISYDPDADYPDGSLGAGMKAEAAEVNDLKSAIGDGGENILAAYPTDNVSGAVASFADGAAMPVKSLVVNIDPVQSGSGDPAPDNVRPISGWTQAKVTRTGKNLLEKPFSFRPVPVKFSDCFFIKAGTYRFSFSSIGTATKWRLCVAEFDASGNALSDNAHKPNPGLGWAASAQAWYGGVDTTSKATTLNFIEDCYIRIQFGSGNTSGSMTSVGAQLEVGTTETEYEPYSGTTLTIDLDGTIYGGTLDVTTGVLTVTHQIFTLDGSADEYIAGSGNRIACAALANSILRPSTGNTLIPGNISNWLNYIKGDQTYVGNLVGFSLDTSGYVYISDGTHSMTKDGLRAKLQDDPLVLVLAIPTPQTVQLDPETLSTLLGENNVWADTGDVNVTYRADPTLYIEKLTGSTEDDMIADSAIANGKYFLVGNRLFKATAAIAAGATLTPGTNCTETNLAAALNALNS